MLQLFPGIPLKTSFCSQESASKSTFGQKVSTPTNSKNENLLLNERSAEKPNSLEISRKNSEETTFLDVGSESLFSTHELQLVLDSLVTKIYFLLDERHTDFNPIAQASP